MKKIIFFIILFLFIFSFVYSIKSQNKDCIDDEPEDEENDQNLERCSNCCKLCYPPKGSKAPILLLCKESCPDYCCEYMGCEKKECPYTHGLRGN